MGIRYIEHSEIDKTKWDLCIAKAHNGMLYAYSWYLDIVSKKWDALIENDYSAVFPLTFKTKFGIKYLYPPFFTQQLGIYSSETITDTKFNLFIEAIPPKFKFVEIYLNKNNNFNSSLYALTPNKSFEIDLNYTYETLYKNFSTNTKRNINKAIKSNISIKKINYFEEIIELFRENRGHTIKTITESDYITLKLLIKELINRKMVEIWAAYNVNGELCAGVFYATSNQKTIFLFSGRNQEAKSNGAMAQLISKYIERNANNNLIFDFAGSNDANLARFYKSFGAIEYPYFLLKINRLPWFLKYIKK